MNKGLSETSSRLTPMMQLVVQLSQDVAAAYTRGSAEPLRRVLKDLGVSLEPLTEGVDDPVLATFFQANLPSSQDGADVVTRLIKVPGVSAAYIEPKVALP